LSGFGIFHIITNVDGKTKSRKICEQLRKEIVGGRYDVTRKLPSEHQLMRRFSVARETIRAALKELLAQDIVDRRPGYGTFLTEGAAVSAARKFGVIVPDAYYSFYARICQGLDAAAKENGWTTLSVSLGAGDMRERAVKAVEFAELCVREKVSGVFFQPLQFLQDGVMFNRAILAVFEKAGIPVVLLDSDFVALPQRSAYDLVDINNIQAGYELARHVIARGAKHIWYFSNPLPSPTSVNRGNGVGLAVTEAGLSWTRDSIFFADPTDARAAKRLFAGRNRPDAILAVNDYVASILLKTLKTIGIRVPEDVLLAGFNGDPAGAECVPPLTTMVQPCEQIGSTAVTLMLGRLREPAMPAREVCLSATLMVRASTGTARTALATRFASSASPRQIRVIAPYPADSSVGADHRAARQRKAKFQ